MDLTRPPTGLRQLSFEDHICLTTARLALNAPNTQPRQVIDTVTPLDASDASRCLNQAAATGRYMLTTNTKDHQSSRLRVNMINQLLRLKMPPM